LRWRLARALVPQQDTFVARPSIAAGRPEEWHVDPQVSVVLLGRASTSDGPETPHDLRQDLPLEDLELLFADGTDPLPLARGSVVLLLDHRLVPAADLARQALATIAAAGDREREVLLARISPPAFGPWDLVSDALASRGTWAEISDGSVREPRRLAARCFCFSRSGYARFREAFAQDRSERFRSDAGLGFRLWNLDFRLRFQPRLRAHHPRLLSIEEAVSHARLEGAIAFELAERNPEFRRKLSLPSDDALARAEVSALERRLAELVTASLELVKIDPRALVGSETHALGLLPAMSRVADLVVAEALDAASWLGWLDHRSAATRTTWWTSVPMTETSSALETSPVEPSWETAAPEDEASNNDVSTYDQPATHETVAEPTWQESPAEPMWQEAPAEPTSQEALAEPTSQEALAEPTWPEASAEPSQEAPPEPTWPEALAEPPSQEVSVEPASWEDFAEPASQRAFTEPEAHADLVEPPIEPVTAATEAPRDDLAPGAGEELPIASTIEIDAHTAEEPPVPGEPAGVMSENSVVALVADILGGEKASRAVAPPASAAPFSPPTPPWFDSVSDDVPAGTGTLVMPSPGRPLIEVPRSRAEKEPEAQAPADDTPATLVMESPWQTGEISRSLVARAASIEANATKELVATIVIVSRNNAGTLRACLEAVARETPESHEVVVVDNASSDGTQEIARRAGAHVIAAPEPEGYARAANRALREAHGTNVVFLAPDTVVAPGWLKGLLDAMELGVGAVGPASNGLLGCQQVMRWVTEPSVLARAEDLIASLRREAPISIPVRYLQPSCVLVPRTELAVWGNLETRLQLPQSAFMHLAWQLAQSGKTLRVAPRSFVSRPAGLRRATGTAMEAGLPESAAYEYERRFRRDMEFLRTEITASNPQRSVSSQEIWGVSWTGFDETHAVQPDVPLVSIVIPVFNQLEYTRQCLQSLAQSTVKDVEIIVFDNGSTDGTSEFLHDAPNVRTLTSSTNLGFAPAANRGIAASNGRYVLVLNNDVVVPAAFLEHVLATADAHPECGLLGPVSNNCAALQQVPADYTDVAGLESFAASRWEALGNCIRHAPVIVGFAMFARREVIDSIGGFDERFEIGNFEDNDFSLRCSLMGWKLGIADGVFIHHYGSRTFAGEGFDYAALMRENQERFLAKWHGISAKAADGAAERAEPAPAPPRDAVGASPSQPETPGWIPVDAVATPHDPVRSKDETMTANHPDTETYEPTSGDLYLVANARFEEGKYEEAVELFRWSIEAKPDLVLAHMGLGLALARLGRNDEAIPPLEKCVELDPTFSEGYNNLGVAYHLAGWHDRARDAIQRAIALDPQNLEARANLNEVLFRTTMDASESASAA